MKTNRAAPSLISIAVLLIGALLGAPVLAGPMLEGHIDRPLHFHPDGRDFVVENGSEYFNRPLYGPNNGFRIDAGDRPEFSLYLPGRGGNLRLGIAGKSGAKWLAEAQNIVARYRPGSMLYEISDPAFGGGVVHLTALPVDAAEGLVIRIEMSGATEPVKLFWAFGGASGERGSRDGDIGTEREPVSQYFQLRPESCAGNSYAIEGNKFTLTSKPAAIVGLAPAGARLGVGNAASWTSADGLLGSIGKPAQLPVLVGQYDLPANQPAYLALQRISRPGDDRGELGTYLAVRQEKAGDATQPTVTSAATQPAVLESAELPRIFELAEKHRTDIADKVIADTPDAFINAAVSALCVAANGVWDERQGTFMHGAVAWRSKLLGWRGAYAGDELGWHDRAVRDMDYWSGRQNLSEIAARIPPLDPTVNLSRDEPALHSNGDLSNSHYDMNLVFIDALFRHILWTGDLDYARKMWPVIEKHLAWERRLFRRTYGADPLPLYEAYCCIWASDDLEYSGGGAAHSTAYNYYHNLMAARIAHLIGADGAPYEAEANSIAAAMRKHLWLADRGWFGEFKDLLGEQQVHPSAALWTFYHTVDSQVPSPMEAWQMSRFVDTQIAHIPILGKDVPPGNFTLPTTNWMFYTWSTNNVVMAESAHTSLAYWQADRADEAFKLFKGCVLDSMYQGLCPGNAGMCTYFDVARGESQRDFGDAVGTCSRAVVEGLYGIKPDVLKGEVVIRPGFPAEWEHASLKHPDFNFKFVREGLRETYTFDPAFPKLVGLRLQIAALRDGIESIAVNGDAAKWQNLGDTVGSPRVEIQCGPQKRFEIVIVWKGQAPAVATAPAVIAEGFEIVAQLGAAGLKQIADPQTALSQLSYERNGFRGIATGTMGHRSVFAQVQQGELSWWIPVAFEIRPPLEIVPSAEQDEGHLRFRLRNNTAQNMEGLLGVSAGPPTARNINLGALSESPEISVSAGGLPPGTQSVSAGIRGSRAATGRIVNWNLRGQAALVRMEPVDLSGVFNDELTNIFAPGKYVSPRSAFCSLSMPSQGIGSWCRPTAMAQIDDSGLRRVSDQHNGKLVLPQGIVFRTPGVGGGKNIAFASQWDNYPREIVAPLSGRGSHLYLLMAGSTNWMQSRFENGRVVVAYSDGSTSVLRLENPTNWWPIEQDYLIDDYAFRRLEPLPIRVDLRSGNVRTLEMASFKGHGGRINGGAATVLDLPLHAGAELKSLTLHATANEVVLGLMSATLIRPPGN